MCVGAFNQIPGESPADIAARRDRRRKGFGAGFTRGRLAVGDERAALRGETPATVATGGANSIFTIQSPAPQRAVGKTFTGAAGRGKSSLRIERGGS